MNKSGSLVVILLVLLGGVAWFLFGQAPVALDNTASTTAPGATTGSAAGAAVEATAGQPATASDAGPARTQLSEAGAPALDAAYTRALAGFRGRLVLPGGKPAPDRAVQMFRIDPEIAETPFLFAEQPQMRPMLEPHEARSGEDGTFRLTGVWPRALHLLIADAGGEHQKVTLVERTPGPGEVVDLGDIQLEELGILTGRVVDMDGEPAAGALVRALDIPGFVFELAPIERIDPDGGLIIDDRGFKAVATMPPWLRAAYDRLPIPATTSGADGAFELRGVPPGLNTVLVNLRGHVPMVRKAVSVRAGRTSKLGKLALKEGEILEGRVRDAAGQPVVGAEVMVASKSPAMPVQFGSLLAPTDAEGRFSGSGMAAAPVYVAVRRSKLEAWIIHGPAAVGADIEIRIPTQVALTLRLRTADGRVPEGVEIRLCNIAGENGPGANLASVGMLPLLDVTGRAARQGKDRYRIPELIPGDYTAVVRAAGYAAAKVSAKVTADTELEVTLDEALGLEVVVVDTAGKPIRNAKVYVEVCGEQREQRVMDMPVMAGRTDGAGRVRVAFARRGAVNITASHPAYGLYHMPTSAPATGPVVIKMREAGVLVGTLTDGGRPPQPGRYAIAVVRHWRESRGAIPAMPQWVVPDLEGRFRVHGLAPGTYRVGPIPAPGSGSPGGMIKNLIAIENDRRELSVVEVPAGGEVVVRLDASGRREATGPSAQLTGTVMVNGRPGTGLLMSGWSRGGWLHVEVDAAGRFDLGRVEVGSFTLQLKPTPGPEMKLSAIDGELWRHQGLVEENKDQQFDIHIQTGGIVGTLRDPAGNPVAGAEVEAQGSVRVLVDRPKQVGHARMSAATNAQGRFEFDQLPTGVYSLTVRGERGWVVRTGISIQPGAGAAEVDLQLEKVYTVEGRVDLSVYPKSARADYMYLQFQSKDQREVRGGARVDTSTGEFVVTGLPRGSYTTEIICWGENTATNRNGGSEQPVTVTGDVRDLVIRPVFETPKRK